MDDGREEECEGVFLEVHLESKYRGADKNSDWMFGGL